jgi:muramoyltetrapeptide carboxypeptidase LdcA involved in peptidoglycan recycling
MTFNFTAYSNTAQATTQDELQEVTNRIQTRTFHHITQQNITTGKKERAGSVRDREAEIETQSVHEKPSQEESSWYCISRSKTGIRVRNGPP